MPPGHEHRRTNAGNRSWRFWFPPMAGTLRAIDRRCQKALLAVFGSHPPWREPCGPSTSDVKNRSWRFLVPHLHGGNPSGHRQAMSKTAPGGFFTMLRRGPPRKAVRALSTTSAGSAAQTLWRSGVRAGCCWRRYPRPDTGRRVRYAPSPCPTQRRMPGTTDTKKPRRSGALVARVAHRCADARRLRCSRARRGRCRPGADGRSSFPDRPAAPASAIPSRRCGRGRT